MKLNRHDFLKTVATTGLITSAEVGGLTTVFGQSDGGANADLVAVMGGEPGDMFAKAIETLGGMSRFVKSGQKIVVKPNIGWDKKPELAGDTNPDLIGAIVKACMEAGAASVSVFDHTCDANWKNCYRNSGIEQAVEAAGGRMVPGNDENYYVDVELPRGKNLKKTKIHRELIECDAWINVPVLKNHGGAKMTIAMKNYMGIVWDRRYFHKNDLSQCIADVCTWKKKAVLNIVDGYRVMKSNGPRGKSEADVVLPKVLFASPDVVAVDTAATALFNQIVPMPLENVKHIVYGAEMKLGTSDLSGLNVKRIRL